MPASNETRVAEERAILVGLDLKSRSHRGSNQRGSADPHAHDVEESLDELKSLADTAGAHVEETIVQSRQAPDSATLIGSGKLDELRRLVTFHDAHMVLFDAELTPTQLRNLERALDCKILDRTQLILDIFARRARTREGQLQVELAQLNYLLPRLAGRGTEMTRQGGGIGTRGPGETQLETDRRGIYRRIKKLNDQLEGVRGGRGTQRRQRQSVPLATIALVGYTNAGKSTLFNRLTGAAVVADARMFATLDPTVRHLTLPSRRKVLASDTVGFIRNLPTTLVKAFRATLEEVTEAALLLHVVDASSPSAPQHTAHVFEVLSDIGADQTRQILVLNKTDLIKTDLIKMDQIDPAASAGDIESLTQRILGEVKAGARTVAVPVSSRTGAGFDALLEAIDNALPLDPVSRQTFLIPAGEGSVIHLLHERAKVLSSQYRGDVCELEAEVPESIKRRLSGYLVE